MRKEFADELFKRAQTDERIKLLTGDLGYGIWDQYRTELPDQFYNVGASEQLMIGMAVGMAQEGFIPFCYSITPFLLWRGGEWIRNYVDYERCPVVLVGSGRNNDYRHDGFTHFGFDDKDLMFNVFKNIKPYWPHSVDQLSSILDNVVEVRAPYYINLKR